MTKLAGNDYPIHDLLRKRWSPRAFSARPIEPAELLSLFEAARWAPSSFNDQPRAFLVARREETEKFVRLLDALVEFNQGWARTAAALVLTVARSTYAHDGKPNRHSWHDVGLAVAHLTLQATAQGLFVHQMAGIVPDRARELLAIPDGWDPVSALAIGYLGDPATLPDGLRQRELAESTRKPLSEFVFSVDWGQPL
jgi:nitroreductase